MTILKLFVFTVEGSAEPELCPAGTFSALSGLTSETSCEPCTAGFYCREAGLKAPTGLCSQGQHIHCAIINWYYNTFGSGLFYKDMCVLHSTVGYWCPPGQTVSTALPCPPGHFCLQGSAAPEPCPSGTFQSREKQSSCNSCEAGRASVNYFYLLSRSIFFKNSYLASWHLRFAEQAVM